MRLAQEPEGASVPCRTHAGEGRVWPFDVEQGYGHFQRDADRRVRHAGSRVFAR